MIVDDYADIAARLREIAPSRMLFDKPPPAIVRPEVLMPISVRAREIISLSERDIAAGALTSAEEAKLFGDPVACAKWLEDTMEAQLIDILTGHVGKPFDAETRLGIEADMQRYYTPMLWQQREMQKASRWPIAMFAEGADLDKIGGWYGLDRGFKTVSTGHDVAKRAVGFKLMTESDAAFRQRILLAHMHQIG
jgi:hypothetical protein